MNNYEAKKLLVKYRAGECTSDEIILIESWYLNDNEEDIVILPNDLTQAKDNVWATLPVHESVKTKHIKLWPVLRLVAAAVIVISVSVGLYLNKQQTIDGTIVKAANNNILPGGKKALLTLADGSSIVLNDAQNGKLADQKGTSVVKTANGELVYNDGNNNAHKVVYNQLTIPRGGYYCLTLADGTKVWLNSESSLKYPTDFVGNERVVELTGEGYFEVAHRKNQPFKVVTNQQTVEVLGTHFNINAYTNEKVTSTTLLEGSIRVLNLKSHVSNLLKPGQQAAIQKSDISISDVDTEEAIAWVNNNFNFNNEELGSIMRKISRWYDVEVICPPDLEQMEFIGKVSRTKNIKDVIKIMEETNAIHFKVEGRRITVMH